MKKPTLTMFAAGTVEAGKQSGGAIRRPAARLTGGVGGKSGTNSRRTGLVFLIPVVIFIGLFFVYPLIENVVISLENYTSTSFYSGRAPYVGFANYKTIFDSYEFWPAVKTTVIFTVASIAVSFSVGLGLAVFFTRRFPLNSVIRSVLLLPWLLPLVVSGTIFRWMFSQENGVIDQVLRSLHIISSPIPWLSSAGWALAAVTIVNIWVGIPFNMVILYGGLQAIDKSLYEAAALDGASGWTQFRCISLPLLRPVAIVALTLGVIYTLKVFDVIMIVTQGGPAYATQTLTIWAYNLSFVNFSFGQGAAVGNLMVVVALVFAIGYLRTIKRDIKKGVA